MPRLPPLTEMLDDGSVRLRDASSRDIPEVLIAYEDDPAMHERLFEERPPSGAALGRRAESDYADRAAGCRATLTVLGDGSDTCVGQLSVHDLDWEHARGELSLWIAPRARRRGLASASLRLACGWLFERCALARLQVLVEPDNVGMLRTAARAGFHDEGVLRGHVRRRGQRLDVTVLSVLAAEREGE
jgi:RimJ/RimL family protein N-acetyltransferase